MVQQASMAGLSKSMAGAVLLGAAMLAAPSQGKAQAAYEVMPLQQIPRGYDSWSLFLVCNPAWLLENGDRGVAELFRAYKAFGQAIGPKNLAIWFWKAPAMTPTLENTDIGRMSEYCQKYRLTPSDTPQVVATTRHPDEPEPGDRVVANLNGDAANSARALTDLTDQLLKTGLNQSGLDDSDRWRRVASAGSAALSSVACYFNKVSISIKTGALNAELTHSSDRGC